MMRAQRRLRKMATKLEDQEILMAEAEHKNQGNKEGVLTSTHREQVLFNSNISYISHL